MSDAKVTTIPTLYTKTFLCGFCATCGLASCEESHAETR